MTLEYDVVVVGAGNAGQAAAGLARDAGLAVAVLESAQIGGVCPNRGCVPKKILVAAAEALDTIRRASTHHIQVGPATLDWRRLIQRKRELIASLPDSMEQSLIEQGIAVHRGAARFVGRTSLAVGDLEVEGRAVVVATGSKPRPLGFPGAELVSSSDDFLEMDELPRRVLFVGAGVISLEFAHVLLRAGAEVTLLEMGPRPLAPFDADAVEKLSDYTRRLGGSLIVSAHIERIEAASGGYRAMWRDDAGTHELEVDRIFHGAGRVPALDHLNLAAAGVSLQSGRVPVDAHLRSTENPSLHFAGDCLIDSPQLSPVATYEGRIIGHNILGGDLRAPDYSAAPSAVYSIPALAMVGLTEPQARARGLDFEARVNDPSAWLSGKTHAEEIAYAKLLVERSTDQIIGAHLLGHGAVETIHLLALAMRQRVPSCALRDAVYAYPTFSSDMKSLV